MSKHNIAKRAVIFGGSGQLGEVIVKTFKASGFHVTSVDFKERGMYFLSLTLF